MSKHHNIYKLYKWHSLVDSVYCSIVTKLSSEQFFNKGWGDRVSFEKQHSLFVEKLKQWKEARNFGKPLQGPSIAENQLQWTYDSASSYSSSSPSYILTRFNKKQPWLWNRVAEVWKLRLREACFLSPATEGLIETGSLSSFPGETRMARFLVVEPLHSSTSTLVIHLAATGDHGYNRRLFCFALPLASSGISSVILENPYYGSRKPAHQVGSKLAYVQDLLLLGFATILECISIAKYFSEGFGYRRICFTGLSQGGLHAAMAASLYPLPVATVAAFSPHSAVPVFTDGVLRQSCSWNQLAATMNEALVTESLCTIQHTEGDSHQIREYYDQASSQVGQYVDRKEQTVLSLLSNALALSDIRHFPQPANPRAAVLLAGENDKYVPKDCVDMFSRAWPQMEIRWIPSGHVTGFLFYRQHIFQAILDSLARV
ncbi:hypothetical protein GpartN1_g687.t1 [Galdieria partita]|uniref:Uncharacterized protein n=1 Tax=Galdieria partita TaxID=83374 RepID=A0A9C7PS84_9RHOD|nr:hypothetical protein GpartN1_g687.t1 [Galdieria partita]